MLLEIITRLLAPFFAGMYVTTAVCAIIAPGRTHQFFLQHSGYLPFHLKPQAQLSPFMKGLYRVVGIAMLAVGGSIAYAILFV